MLGQNAMGIVIEFIREDWADPRVALPCYATEQAAGADIRANLDDPFRRDGFDIAPMSRRVVPTGLRVAIPDGYEMQIRPRSGLALSHGVTVINAPGTIDSDYRGPLGVLLVNLGVEPFRILHGSRIAQAVIAPVVRAEYRPALALADTARGSGGFGSTGTS